MYTFSSGWMAAPVGGLPGLRPAQTISNWYCESEVLRRGSASPRRCRLTRGHRVVGPRTCLSLPEIEGRALALHLVGGFAQQAIGDHRASPSHQAQVGIGHAAHVPGGVLGVNPEIGRPVPTARKVGAYRQTVPIPTQPVG